MKKLLILALIAALCSSATALDSVSANRGLIGKGVKLGFSFATATGSDSDLGDDANKKFRVGISGGLFFTFGVADMLAIQPEVLYSMKGAKYTEEGGDGKLTWKYDYIEIPVLLKVMPQTQGTAKPSFFFGPYLGILMNGKWKLEGGGDASAEADVKDDMKSTELGLSFGAGVDFLSGKNKITLDGRYDLGMTSVFEDIEGESIDVKTGTISFMVGYSF